MRPIAGVEGYSVTRFGQVFSHERERELRQHKNYKDGYYRVFLYSGGRRCAKLVHRLVAECYVSNPDAKPHVNHINGDKTDNRAENLEWATRKENQQHALRLGRYRTKLSKLDVLDVLALRAGGISYQKIAREYHLAHATVRAACLRETHNSAVIP